MTEPRSRLTQEIADVILTRLPDIGPEEIVWDLTLVLTQQGPMIHFFFWMPGAIIGTTVSTVLMISNPEVIKVEDVDMLLHTAYESLQQKRSEQLAEAQAIPVESNGDALHLPHEH